MKRWVARILIVSGCGWLALFAGNTIGSLSWRPYRDVSFVATKGVVTFLITTLRVHQPARTPKTDLTKFGVRFWPLRGEFHKRLVLDSTAVHILRIPLWLPALACLIPGLWLWRKNRRPPEGHCQTCGYDLTGNESGVCSECGVGVVEAE